MNFDSKYSCFMRIFLILCVFNIVVQACQFASYSEKIKNKQDTLPMAEQLKLLNEEISTIDSLWVMEMKKNTEKDTALLRRLEEIQKLRTSLAQATKSNDYEKQITALLTIKSKIAQNKAQTENKILRDTLDFLREKNQILEKDLQTKNPQQYQANLIAEQHYQKMIQQNQALQKEIAKLKNIAYLTKFDIRACQENGKTAKYAKSVYYFEVNFAFSQTEKPITVPDHRISYKAYKDGKDVVFRKITDATRITLSSEKFRKGRYDIIMLLDGKEVGKTAIDLSKFL